MAIVSEKFLDELIKGGYIKDEAILGVSKEGGAKWQQLRAQLKHRFTSEDIRYAPVTNQESKTLLMLDTNSLPMALTSSVRHRDSRIVLVTTLVEYTIKNVLSCIVKTAWLSLVGTYEQSNKPLDH